MRRHWIGTERGPCSPTCAGRALSPDTFQMLSCPAGRPSVGCRVHNEDDPVADGSENAGVSHKENPPTLISKPHAPVDILAVQEIAFIEAADILQSLASHQHTGPGNGLNLNGLIGQGLAVHIEIRKQPGVTSCQRLQIKDPYQRSPRRRHCPPSASLLGTVRVEEQAADHTSPWTLS